MNFSNKDFLRKFDGSADLVTFTQEIVHGKRHFLYIVNSTGVAHCVKKLDLDSKDCWFKPRSGTRFDWETQTGSQVPSGNKFS